MARRKDRRAKGEVAGFDMLENAKGKIRAVAAFDRVAKALAGDRMTSAIAKRINTILRGASGAQHPEAYIAACIKSERVRLAKQKTLPGNGSLGAHK